MRNAVVLSIITFVSLLFLSGCSETRIEQAVADEYVKQELSHHFDVIELQSRELLTAAGGIKRDVFTYEATTELEYATKKELFTLIYELNGSGKNRIWTLAEINEKTSFANWNLTGEWLYESYNKGLYGSIDTDFYVSIDEFENGLLKGEYEFSYDNPNGSSHYFADSGEFYLDVDSDGYTLIFDTYLEPNPIFTSPDKYISKDIGFRFSPQKGVLVFDYYDKQWHQAYYLGINAALN